VSFNAAARVAYCLRQSARAGPGLLVHAAVSVSPFFDNDTFPPGHVTDAMVSPCLQERLQPPSSHFSCLMTERALEAAGPAGPGAPASPLVP
jgi:hypothetical protein